MLKMGQFNESRIGHMEQTQEGPRNPAKLTEILENSKKYVFAHFKKKILPIL